LPAQSSSSSSWGYYPPPGQQQSPGEIAWTFDDDAARRRSNRSSSTSSSGSSLALAGIDVGVGVSSVGAADAASLPAPTRSSRSSRSSASSPPELTVLSRLPEQLSESHALTHGVLLVDKPAGWTAGDVVRAVRWALRGGGGRAGGGGAGGRGPRVAVSHAGALDRHATGLMVLCLGAEAAALLAPRCASLERVYAGTITLGVETATWDALGAAGRDGLGERAAASVAAAMGAAGVAAAAAGGARGRAPPSLPFVPPTAEIVDTMPWDHVTDEAAAAAAAALCGGADGPGGSLLLPAAPRAGGKRAGRAAAWYEERGAAPPVALPARRVPVREFAVWREAGPVLGFRLAAGPGASPRALAHALGEALGTCAHLSSLRREALGGLAAERAWPLDALLPALQAGQGLMGAARRRGR